MSSKDGQLLTENTECSNTKWNELGSKVGEGRIRDNNQEVKE